MVLEETPLPFPQFMNYLAGVFFLIYSGLFALQLVYLSNR